MKPGTAILIILLVFPLTTLANKPDPLERTIFLIQQLEGEPAWASPEIKILLNVPAQTNLDSMELITENCFGLPFKLLVCQPFDPLRELLIIIEHVGEATLKNGTSVFSGGRKFWLTNRHGELERVMYQPEGREMKELPRKANLAEFHELVRAVRHAAEIIEYEYYQKNKERGK